MLKYTDFCTEGFNEQGELISFELTYPENFNFAYDVIDVIAAEAPERTAVVWCDMEGNERTLTFEELSALSTQAAHVFKDAGIAKGDRVMVMLKRHLDYWYVIPALHKLGAVAVPVTHMLTVDDIAYRLSTGSIRGVVATPDEEAQQRILDAIEQAQVEPYLWEVTAAGSTSVAPHATHGAGEHSGANEQEPAPRFVNLPAAMQCAPRTIEREATTAEEPLLMYFTSGTTGNPKAVLHDHTYPLAHIITARYWQQVQEGGLHFTVAETGWAKAAWGKMYGQWLCGSAVMVYDFDNFDPKQLTSIINRYGVTSFCAPPTVFRYLVKKGMHDMPTLTHASTAGEALSPEVFELFKERTGLELCEGYGQTESTLILAQFKNAQKTPGSMGKASPLYAVEILAPDGSFAPDGELGEVVIVPPKTGRSHGIFSGYYENDELYAYVWRDGVYHTGDIAWRDEEGNFWFHGRADDVIKSGGYRIGPYEVEHVLMEHPAVVECSVVGVPDTLRGQAIKAYVVLDEKSEPTAELKKELKEFCNTRLAEYKWVRTVEFVEEMPKTISGKIRRFELRKE